MRRADGLIGYAVGAGGASIHCLRVWSGPCPPPVWQSGGYAPTCASGVTPFRCRHVAACITPLSCVLIHNTQRIQKVCQRVCIDIFLPISTETKRCIFTCASVTVSMRSDPVTECQQLGPMQSLPPSSSHLLTVLPNHPFPDALYLADCNYDDEVVSPSGIWGCGPGRPAPAAGTCSGWDLQRGPCSQCQRVRAQRTGP